MLRTILQTGPPSIYSFLETVLTTLIPLAIIILGTAIYYNRKKTDKLYQRLFGLNADEIDKGYILKMSSDMKNIEEKLDKLNHRRIQDIEIQIDELQSSLKTVESNVGNLAEKVQHKQNRSEDDGE